MTEVITIGEGVHGTVALDPVTMLVCKEFQTRDAHEGAEQAQREHDYLRRLSSVLQSEPYLKCPKPIRVDPENSRVWMTYCSGTRVDHFMMTEGNEFGVHFEHLAEQVAIGLLQHIAEFNEPYYDLATRNMLYDPLTRTLCLVDLVSPPNPRTYGYDTALLEVSLGRFVGRSTYDTIRPNTWRNHNYWEKQQYLIVEVLQRINARNDLSMSLVRKIGDIMYSQIVSRKRGLPRLWYSTVGRMHFRRRRTSIFSKAARKRGSDGSIARNSSLDDTDVDRN